MPHPAMCSIIKTALFDELGAEIAGDLKRWDAALEGVEFTLARAPEFYPVAPGTDGLRVVRVPYGFKDTLLVFYRIESQGTYDAVVLHGAQLLI